MMRLIRLFMALVIVSASVPSFSMDMPAAVIVDTARADADDDVIQFKHYMKDRIVTVAQGSLLDTYVGTDPTARFWLLAGIFFIGMAATFLIARLFRYILGILFVQYARRSGLEINDEIQDTVKPATYFIHGLGFYASAGPLIHYALGETSLEYLGRLCMAFIAFSIASILYQSVDILTSLLRAISKKTDTVWDDLVVDILAKSLRTIVIVISAIVIGQNVLGLNLTAIIAGAGVAGLAISLAAKDTIANFFGCVMVSLERAFKPGDCITVDGINGVVKELNLRSAILVTADGYEVAIPNEKLAVNAIVNISRRLFIRQVDDFPLVRDTTPEKIVRAVEVLHEILDGHEGFNPSMPPRVAFTQIKDWALNLQSITWYHNIENKNATPDYWKWVEWRHRTNLEILRRFRDEDIRLAFPTTTTMPPHEETHSRREPAFERASPT